jgi:hypothetical protein
MRVERPPTKWAKAPTKKDNNMINRPILDAEDYLIDDEPTARPKHGTTVQSGWAAADSFLKRKASNSDSKYASFVKFSEQGVLVRFLDDEPFKVYEEHWVDRTEGKRSFICLGDECPLCTIAGDHPRPKFAFNVVVLSDEEPTTQILIAVPTLARLLQSAHEDAKKGPLSRYFWEIKRLGMGRDTQYTLERVRATDLAEEFELDPDDVAEIVANASRYDESAIPASPREELLTIARGLVS